MKKTLSLRAESPLAMGLMRRRMEMAKSVHYRVVDRDHILLALGHGRHGTVASIRAHEDADGYADEFTVTLAQIDANCDVEALGAQVARALSLHVDLEAFYRTFADDAVLSAIIRRYRGLRLVGETSLFAGVVKTIIGQQLNLAFAGTLVRRLVQLCGHVQPGSPILLFPGPKDLARLSYDDLTAMQFSRRKAEYIIDFARRVADGRLDLDGLWNTEDEAVIQVLTGVRGLGRWSAESVLLFSLGRPNILPAADIGLRNAVRRAYGLDKQPDEQQVRDIGQSWAPWCSYVTLYLWESLND